MFTIEFFGIYLIATSVISYLALNVIRGTVITYNLYSPSKERDLHNKPLPSILGFGFLFLTIVGTFFYSKFFDSSISYSSMIASLLIVSIVGLRDDLKTIGSSEKLLFQLISVLILLYFNPNLIINNLYGFLGINSLGNIAGVIFTSFIGVFMINSFNLIDGIDGNSSLMSIISFSGFAVLFWIENNQAFFGMSILIIGLLVGYIPHNLSKNKKSFMGDTGSLFLGLVMYIFTLVFLSDPSIVTLNLLESKALLPIAPLTLFILPIIDSAGVYSYRVSIGKKPLSADNFHIHHLCLRFFSRSHLLCSLFINGCALAFIICISLLTFSISAFYTILIYFLFVTIIVLYTNKLRSKLRTSLGKRRGNVEYIN